MVNRYSLREVTKFSRFVPGSQASAPASRSLASTDNQALPVHHQHPDLTVWIIERFAGGGAGRFGNEFAQPFISEGGIALRNSLGCVELCHAGGG